MSTWTVASTLKWPSSRPACTRWVHPNAGDIPMNIPGICQYLFIFDWQVSDHPKTIDSRDGQAACLPVQG